MPLRLLPLALALTACGGATTDEPADDTPQPVDKRVDYPDASPTAQVFQTPEMVIPAYSDVMMCYALTYTGEDMGIVHMTNYQGPGGHHLVIFGTTTTERELPDGTQWDCTNTEDLNMEDMEPVIFGGELSRSGDATINELTLPEGMGVVLQAGQRMVLQSHYINTTADPILVQDEAQFEVIPEDQVETWAAVLALSSDRFTIPAGATDAQESFTCAWPNDPVNLLFLGPHMHEWGKAFSTDLTLAGPAATTTNLIDEPVWDAVYRDAPPIRQYSEGEMTLQTGDQVTTRCTWFNDTGADIVFPHEMCVTFGLAYPMKLPYVCNNGNVE
jgi:hypothetical protein